MIRMFIRSLSFIFFFFISINLIAQDTVQQIIPNRFNSATQQQKPYVILISADGFRYDFAEKYNAENLLRLSKEGVCAESMLPSFPSLTFPNHYTIVTGLYPAHHGLVDNSFFDEKKKASYSMGRKDVVRDSSWYGGIPLWVLAENEQMLSASFYWVGSEAAVDGIKPTYDYNYNEAISIDIRIEIVKDWLQLPAGKRPHLITFYLPQVDHAAHKFGTNAKETGDSVHFVDDAIGKLTLAIATLNLPVNYIFVSDHGMTDVDTTNTISLPTAIDTSTFKIVNSDAILHLYAKDKNDVQSTYENLKASAKDYDVYLTTAMPAQWHYSKQDDRYGRIGDIILIPHLPKVFNISNRKITPGKHGFDPAFKDMHATFYAWGPQFKRHTKIDAFENVNIYPLVTKILGLSYTEKIDGNIEVLENILK
ncbi:alkaline phosphatase family protein [Panacibacter ginsenosidivorans]|uniref:Alkaline phosphatase family protein n=1 Tax=Panacibacter ginsenosidivorans TaxID=1813871 RepID=A0A5B8V478_9BACT|nr:ectonucleotide pyrophosphatase/phosphodiesterase [Panacibacter ginsenosidivorans]QEC66180.1 alkaline phosphatase family protein [Panacibacter ginsenosidivorans]